MSDPNPAGRLLFDATIDLTDQGVAPLGYRFVTKGEAFSVGDPVPVTSVLASFLRDGSVVRKERDENRTLVLLVTVVGDDAVSFQRGVSALHRATGKPTTLVWSSAELLGPRSAVFDVLTSALGHPTFGDLDLVKHKQTFRLELTCLPFARSDLLVVDDADTPATTGTVVESCDSTTGWSVGSGSTLSLDTTVKIEGTGSVKVNPGSDRIAFSPYYREALETSTRTGLSISTGVGGYMSIAVRLSLPGLIAFNGVDYPSGLRSVEIQVAGAWQSVSFFSSQALASGFVRWAWLVPAGITVTGLRISSQQYSQTPGDPTVHYDSIMLSPVATTDQVIVKGFDVQGSARAPGAMHVFAPTDGVALSHVLVATVADSDLEPGATPDVRRHTTAGTTTADANALLGSYYALTNAYGPLEIKVPTSQLRAGAYRVVCVTKDTTSLTVESQLMIGGVATGAPQEETGVLASASGGYQFFPVGTMYLPTIPVAPGADAVVRLRFKSPSGSPRLAECFLIPLAADFSIVDCGTGTVSGASASSHLWIDSPSPSNPEGAWWRGPAADRVNARSAWPSLVKPGRHVFTPGGMKVFLCSLGAPGPKVHLEYYPCGLISGVS